MPHAGLIYSGRLAAAVLKRIEFTDTAIVLAPKHTAPGVECAVAPHRTWSMPGFSLDSDTELAQKLADAIPDLELDALAHQREHAIEVQLPFIARLAPQTKVAGIVDGSRDREIVARFADGLAGAIKDLEPRPVLIISTDMNHFAPDEETRRLDKLALDALQQLDTDGFFRIATENNISICGLMPAIIVLETLRRLGSLSRAEFVGYCTTADVTGDPSRVVGYAGMLFA